MNSFLTQYDWPHAVAGLGFFLFGMSELEAGVERLGGRRFKRFLREHTHNTIESVASGTAITAILQSSSLVSLMVLAFVGAGVLELRNAVGIILGANFGTTVTGWLATIVGFKVDIAEYAFYLTGAGALTMFFGREDRISKKIGRVITGFGLMFVGLTALKDAAQQISQSLDLTAIANYPMAVFFVAAVVLTAIIHSSSAMVVITLSSLAANAISLEQAIVVVIGADLGTTMTVIVGAIKGSADKKRVAAAHFLINVATVVLALALRKPILFVISSAFNIQDPLILLVGFHSAFNFLGVLFFLPIVGAFTKFLQARFQQPADSHLRFINKVSVDVPEAAIEAISKEVKEYWHQVRQLNISALPFETEVELGKGAPWTSPDYGKAYRTTKHWEGEITTYALELQRKTLNASESQLLEQALKAIRAATHAAKCLKDIKSDLDQLANIDSPTFRHLLQQFCDAYLAFDRSLFDAVQQVDDDERFQKMAGQFSQNQGQYDRLVQLIYDLARRNQLVEVELSTMLNISREMYSAQKSLLLAAKDAFLAANQAEAIVNVPLVHRTTPSKP